MLMTNKANKSYVIVEEYFSYILLV